MYSDIYPNINIVDYNSPSIFIMSADILGNLLLAMKNTPSVSGYVIVTFMSRIVYEFDNDVIMCVLI